MHLMMFSPTGAFGMDCFAVDIDFLCPVISNFYHFIAIPDIGYLERDGEMAKPVGWENVRMWLVHYEKAWTTLDPDHSSRSSIAPCAWCGTSRKRRVFTHWKSHRKQKMIVQLQSQYLQKEKSSKGEKTCWKIFGRCRYWHPGWHWKIVFFRRSNYIQCFSIVGGPCDLDRQEVQLIPSWLEE